jgi:hypothetical protein
MVKLPHHMVGQALRAPRISDSHNFLDSHLYTLRRWPGTHFCWEVARIKSVKNPSDPHRVLNPRSSGSSHSAPTNCSTACPTVHKTGPVKALWFVNVPPTLIADSVIFTSRCICMFYIILRINQLAFAVESHCTLCKVGTEFLCVPYIKCGIFIVNSV